MSIYDKATLVQIPSGYKASGAKLYSVLPSNGDGDFTVSSDADATRIDENGLIEDTVANQARLSRNFIDGVVQPDPFLLLEPTSTNLLQRSEDYANSYWLKARVGSSTTGFTAPDGSSNATYFEQASGQTTAAVIYKSAFTSVSSGIYTFSIWAKKGDKRYLKFQTRANSATYRTVFDLQDGAITYDSGNENAKIEEYVNGWFRLSVQRTSTTTDDIVVYYYLNDSAGASDTVTDSGGVYIWGSQVEKTDYLTSYIPTTTAQVTRTVDYASGGGNSDTFNDSEGTLFIDAAALGNDGTYRVLNISDGTTSNRVLIQLGNNNNQIRADLISGGATQTSLSTTSYTFTDFNKIAFKYKGDDTALFVNGTQVGTTQTGKTMPTGLDRIDFTNGNLGSTFYFRAKLRQLIYFNTALSDSELQTLTS